MTALRHRKSIFRFILIMIVILGNTLFTNSPLKTTAENELSDIILSSNKVHTYANGLLEVTYSFLEELVGGSMNMTLSNFCTVLTKYFIPLNIRVIGLWIDSKPTVNISNNRISYQKWLDDWLSACDITGVANIFYSRQWHPPYDDQSWDSELLITNPELQAYYPNGTQIQVGTDLIPIVINHPKVIEKLKKDFEALWNYYGKHSSWIGCGILSRNLKDTENMRLGFSFHTISLFARSDYFRSTLNQSGYYYDGRKSKIWELYIENEYPIVLSSGAVQPASWGEDPLIVFSKEKEGEQLVAMKFVVPENLNGFRLRWYGNKLGSPQSPLFLELYEDINDSLIRSLEVPLEVKVQQPDEISSKAQWQSAVLFNSPLLSEKSYWIVFRSLENTSRNVYQIYRRKILADESEAWFSSRGYSGPWIPVGSAVLWLQSLNGTDIKAYPHQIRVLRALSGSDFKVYFTARSNFTFNTIFFHMADMPYDETSPPVEIIRLSDGASIARGLLDRKLLSGRIGWVPVSLNTTVNCVRGETYLIKVSRVGGIAWQLNFLISDPGWAGFEGKNDVLLFKLANINWTIQNWCHMGYNEGLGIESHTPGVTYDTWYAVRIRPSMKARLLNVDLKIFSKYGNPSNLTISLVEDFDGNGKMPGTRVLESKEVRPEEVPSRGWVNTTGWSHILEAGVYYWLVFSMAQPAEDSGYRPVRTLNPFQYKPMYTADRGTTWTGTPEVAELILKAITEKEVFKVEPDERINVRIAKKRILAQSFSVPKTTTIKGVIIPGIEPGCIVELRSDNGFGLPSLAMEPLSLGRAGRDTAGGLALEGGIDYVHLNYPYTLQENVTYWLIMISPERQIEFPVYFFRDPEDSYGGTKHKVIISDDFGNTWQLPFGREGDLAFGIIEQQYSKNISISELADEIVSYQKSAWTLYLNNQLIKIQNEITEWFKYYTGRKWFSILNTDDFTIKDSDLSLDNKAIMSVFLNSSRTSIIPSITLNKDTVNYVKTYYEEILPLIPIPVTLLKIANLSELNYFIKSNLSDFWNTLRCMVYTGKYFGNQKHFINVLFIGDQQSVMLACYLMAVLNVTFLNLSEDYNISRIGNFTSFNVIVWASSRNSSQLLTEDAQKRIKDFIRKGGGFVILTPWAKWADEIVGFSYSDEKITPGLINYVYYTHPIIKPYSNITRDMNYGLGNKVNPTGVNFTYVIRDTNNQPVISTTSYGLGHGILCVTPVATLNGTLNSFTAIVINAIFYAAGKEEVLPILWHEDHTQTVSKAGVQYSISGKPGGPLLLWLVNNGPVASFEIHLNASFFGLNPEGWVVLDIVNWLPVARGQGNDICIHTEINSMSWLPIYIMNDVQELHVLYSNADIETEKTYPNQAIYSIKSYPSEIPLLIIKSGKSLQAVIVDNYSLLKMSSSTFLNVPASIEGWFYDSENELLKVKLKSGGQHTIRVILDTSKPMLSLLDEHKYILSMFLVIFIMIFEFLFIGRARSR